MPRPGRNGREPTKVHSTRPNAPGRIRDALQAWLHIGTTSYQLFLHDETTIVDSPKGPRPLSLESGPTVQLMIPHKRVVIDLSYMTHEELKALREFLNMALDLAEPVVLLRDKEAQDAFDTGDDSFQRLHRPVPQFVVRPRAKRAYGEVLRLGLENVLERGWPFLREYLGTGGSGDGMADESEGGTGSEDDAASSDESASVRPVGGTGSDVPGLQAPDGSQAPS